MIKVFDDYITDKIDLTHDYTHEELCLLMQLDDKTYESARIDSFYRDVLKSNIKSLMNSIPPEILSCDNIKLREIITSVDIGYSTPTSYSYVFDVTISGTNKIMCQNKEIFYNDDLGKYYSAEPYYMGDYYIFIDTVNLRSHISLCSYLNGRNSISPSYPDWTHGMSVCDLVTYHFRLDEDITKAKKLLNNNVNLFMQVYSNKKISDYPPFLRV